MSVQNSTSSVQYTGNASTSTAYPIPFYFFSNGDIVVQRTDANDNVTTLTLGADYAVTGSGVSTGGSITTTAAWDDTNVITISRVLDFTQPTSYTNAGQFPASSHEKALDRLTMLCQQLFRYHKKSVRGSDSSPDLMPIPAQPSIGTYVLGVVNNALQWITPSTAAIGNGSVIPSNISTQTTTPWSFAAVVNGLLGFAGNLTGNVTGNLTGTPIAPTPLSNRNRLINGNFSINQRGYVSGTATTGANQYAVDRWKVIVAGQNLAWTASGNDNIVTALSGGVAQVIESLNIEGGTYVLSWVGTATAKVNGTSVANGGTIAIAAGTQTTVAFYSGTVSLAQLEPGSVATVFERRQYQQELALCQRYYQLPGLYYSSSSGIYIQLTGNWPVCMRAAPTCTTTGVGLAVVRPQSWVAITNTTGGVLTAEAEL